MIHLALDDAEVNAALAQLAGQLADLTPAMQEVGEMMVESSKARIRAGVTPDGAAFAPRSAATLAAYARRNQTYSGVLMMTGTMQSQIFAQPGAEQVEIGSNAIQAAVMQWGQAKGASGQTSRGGPIPWGNIPPRPFLGVSDADRTGIEAIVAEWLDRAIT